MEKNSKVGKLKELLTLKKKLVDTNIFFKNELDNIDVAFYDSFVYESSNHYTIDLKKFQQIFFFKYTVRGDLNQIVVDNFLKLKDLLTIRDFDDRNSITLKELEDSSIYEHLGNNKKQMFKILDVCKILFDKFPMYFSKVVFYDDDLMIVERYDQHVDKFDINNSEHIKQYVELTNMLNDYIIEHSLGINIYLRYDHLCIKNGKIYVKNFPNLTGFPLVARNMLINNTEERGMEAFLFDDDNIHERVDRLKVFIRDIELEYFDLTLIDKKDYNEK